MEQVLAAELRPEYEHLKALRQRRAALYEMETPPPPEPRRLDESEAMYAARAFTGWRVGTVLIACQTPLRVRIVRVDACVIGSRLERVYHLRALNTATDPLGRGMVMYDEWAVPVGTAHNEYRLALALVPAENDLRVAEEEQ
jgi:hypothetical protein